MKNHKSDCAVHNEPAYPNGECDCAEINLSSAIETLNTAIYDDQKNRNNYWYQCGLQDAISLLKSLKQR